MSYFGIGICHSKTTVNVGTLLRSAMCLGAAFTFTIARRYNRENSDVYNAAKHVPLYNFQTVAELSKFLPSGARLVGVDCNVPGRYVHDIQTYEHPVTCVYLLGAEDHGLTKEELNACHEIITIPLLNRPFPSSLNVATAGSIVMYDRMTKELAKKVPQAAE